MKMYVDGGVQDNMIGVEYGAVDDGSSSLVEFITYLRITL